MRMLMAPTFGRFFSHSSIVRCRSLCGAATSKSHNRPSIKSNEKYAKNTWTTTRSSAKFSSLWGQKRSASNIWQTEENLTGSNLAKCSISLNDYRSSAIQSGVTEAILKSTCLTGIHYLASFQNIWSKYARETTNTLSISTTKRNSGTSLIRIWIWIFTRMTQRPKTAMVQRQTSLLQLTGTEPVLSPRIYGGERVGLSFTSRMLSQRSFRGSKAAEWPSITIRQAMSRSLN